MCTGIKKKNIINAAPTMTSQMSLNLLEGSIVGIFFSKDRTVFKQKMLYKNPPRDQQTPKSVLSVGKLLTESSSTLLKGFPVFESICFMIPLRKTFLFISPTFFLILTNLANLVRLDSRLFTYEFTELRKVLIIGNI